MFLLTTVIGFMLTPPLLLITPLSSKLSADKTVRQIIRIYGWILIRVVPFMNPVVLEDRSGGFDKPVIFIPNHNSSVDPFLFGMLPVDNAFVTSWPFRIPFYNFFMHLAGYINSTKGWPHIRQRGKKLLNTGCSLIIWPEGHRTRTGNMGRFKKGAFQLAVETGRQIVPVCIVGSRQLLPPGQIFLTPARIKIILLPPLDPAANIQNHDAVIALKERTKAHIAAELQKHLPGKSARADKSATRISPVAETKTVGTKQHLN